MLTPVFICVIAGVAQDGLELLDAEPHGVNSLGTLHIHNTTDTSVVDVIGSSGPRSLLVQQRKPGNHGDNNDEDETVGADDVAVDTVQFGQ